LRGIKIVVSYILINTNPVKEYEVYNQLQNVSGIIELKPLFREYDMIAKVKTKSEEKLEKIISNKIKPLNGIVNTKIIG
jgi:DNA-binding Lrp family transcriptional regulator